MLYLVLAVVSGIVLMATEMLQHRQLLREPAGLTTIDKLVLKLPFARYGIFRYKKPVSQKNCIG